MFEFGTEEFEVTDADGARVKIDLWADGELVIRSKERLGSWTGYTTLTTEEREALIEFLQGVPE